MSKLNTFAELIAEAKRQKQREEELLKEKKQREIAPLLSDMFKTVEKAKIESDKTTAIKKEVVELVKKLESDVENVREPVETASNDEVNTNTSPGEEKRFERLLKQLQNDFATLKRNVDSIPRNVGISTAGSGEVRIARMDDISKVAPKNGDTLVWNASKGLFEYVPINTNNGTITDEEMPYAKRIDFVSDALIYKGEAAVGSLETDPVWRIRKLIIGLDGDVTEVWADGNSNYDNIWTDRLTYTYS